MTPGDEPLTRLAEQIAETTIIGVDRGKQIPGDPGAEAEAANGTVTVPSVE